jgi:tRNA-splicing ligase RtcB
MFQLSPKAITFLPPDTIEPQAVQQILNVSEMPFIYRHVAVMPDCHLGKGATIGTVMATEKAVIPAAVGVDIGCGMIAVRTRFSGRDIREKDLKAIRRGIEKRVPAGSGQYNSRIGETAEPRVRELETMRKELSTIDYDKSWPYQLGTLGSGNHFIELSIDETDTLWIVLHSGSRGVGNRIAQHYIKVAQKICREMHVPLKDRDLAYLPQSLNVPEFDQYIHDLHWAQEFALRNRDEMMDRVIAELASRFEGSDEQTAGIEVERINCHHNFTQMENHFGRNVWITRKGAIEAREGMKAVIPGSMGTRSYIVSGLGNRMAFRSAPHGAGRRFSRTEARRRFTMEDFEREMLGIEWRREKVLLDEIPSAYKDIDQVMEYSRDLVRIEHTLRQIVNVKGD